MCYNRRDYSREAAAHSRLQQHEEEEAWEEARRRGQEAKSRRRNRERDKLLTEKVMEEVGVAR
jgi:hypothetical protein